MPAAGGTRGRRPRRLDAVFHALGDPTRRALLRRLARGPAMVTELAVPFSMSLPAVSKHLKVLEAAGLLAREVQGRVHRCTLTAEPLEEAGRWIAGYRAFWEHTLDALGRYVDAGVRPERPRRRRRA